MADDDPRMAEECTAVTAADAARIERAIAEAHLSAYQAMVVRTIAEGENVTAALDWIEACKEVGDGATE